MAYYIRKKKVVDECDGGMDMGCAAPMTDVPDGIGSVIPGHSGDRFDNILGAGFNTFINNTMQLKPKRKYRVRKRKSKK